MADAQRIIELIFNGVDKTGAATKSALDNASKLSRGIEDATQPIANFTASAVKLEAGLLAAGVAITAFAVKSASDFQSAALDLAKVLGDTDPPLEQFTNRARELSREFGIASTDVLQSMSNFKQAGFTAEEAATLTKNSIELMIAGDIDAARGSDMLVASIKGFRAEASDAAVIIDLLNAVSNEYATNLEELIIGFAELSPVAKSAGLSFEQTAGLLTPGIEVFRSGSEVATALRTSLLRLQSDSKPVQEALQALGVAQHDTNGQLRQSGDIYFDVAQAFGNLNDSQKTYYAAQLVGMNQSAKFLAVVEGLDKTLRISGEGFEYAGSAAEEVAVRLASAEIAAERAKVAFNDMFVSIGDPLLDEFSGMAGAIAGIFNAVGASVREGQLGGLVGYVESIMGDLQATMETVARNLPAALEQADLSGFTRGIDVVREAFELLFDNIDLTTVDGLTRAIELAGTAFLGLSQFTAGVIESFKPLFDYITALGTGMASMDDSVFKAAGELAGFVTQANMLAGSLNSVMPLLEGLLAILLVRQGAGLVGAIGKAATALSGAGGLVALLGQAGLVGAAGAAGYAVGTVLATGIDKVVEATTDSSSLGAWIADLVWADEIAAAAAISVDSLRVPVTNLTRAANDSSVALDDLLVPMDKLYRGANLTGEALDRHNANMLNNVSAMREGASAAFEYANSLQAQEDAAAGLRPIFDDLTGAIIGYERVATAANGAAADSWIGVVAVLDEATGAIIGYEQGVIHGAEATDALGRKMSDVKRPLSEIADEAKKAEDAQRRWNEEVQKMQHAERLAIIEQQAQITTTRIQAGAETIKAAYESLNTTIVSTGETITDLWGIMAGGDLNLGQKWDLERQINLENDRRGEALDLQKRLTEAQIDEMEARARALSAGDGMITIQGDGLAPHLEAFMWEILRAIQVRVNQEGLDMLLGA